MMMKRRSVLFLFIITLFFAGCDPATISKVSVTGTATMHVVTPMSRPFAHASQIDDYLNHLAATDALTGSVLVFHNGSIFSKGYGWADKDTHQQNTTKTLFRIGSLTKQFTAMAILILQQRGKLHVQDTLCTYIAHCPSAWLPITLYELLIHSSGIPNYTDFADFLVTWKQPVTVEQLIARFKDKPLDFAPGTKWGYSNSGYILLGSIIEQMSGMSYAKFLQQAIFEPLHMQHTGYDTGDPHLAGRATGYYSGYIKPDSYNMSVFYAAGALYSNVEDLFLWDQALALHRLVSEQSLNEIIMPHISCPPHGCLLPTDAGYGYGWFIADQPEGRLTYHLGRVDGYLTFNGFFRAENIDVVVLSNLESSDVLKIATTLATMASQ